MHNVDPDDAGEYLLLVRNPRGVADATVILNVTHASGLSTAPVADADADGAAQNLASNGAVLILALLAVFPAIV